jgi:hypothetical protein
MIEEDAEDIFFVRLGKYEKNKWVKTGVKVGAGEYSPIITQLFCVKQGR